MLEDGSILSFRLVMVFWNFKLFLFGNREEGFFEIFHSFGGNSLLKLRRNQELEL